MNRTLAHFVAAGYVVANVIACNSSGSRDAGAFGSPSAIELANAVGRGDEKRVKVLVTQGASPDSMSSDGYSILDWALEHNELEVFKLLLKLGADPNLRHPQAGATTLFFVSYNPNPEWIRTLLNAGADPNIATTSNDTAIFEALATDSTTNVGLLLDAGADINHQNSAGDTLAMAAATLFKYDITLFLLKRGACTSPKNLFGQDLREIATINVPADADRDRARQQVLESLGERAREAC